MTLLSLSRTRQPRPASPTFSRMLGSTPMPSASVYEEGPIVAAPAAAAGAARLQPDAQRPSSRPTRPRLIRIHRISRRPHWIPASHACKWDKAARRAGWVFVFACETSSVAWLPSLYSFLDSAKGGMRPMKYCIDYKMSSIQIIQVRTVCIRPLKICHSRGSGNTATAFSSALRPLFHRLWGSMGKDRRDGSRRSGAT